MRRGSRAAAQAQVIEWHYSTTEAEKGPMWKFQHSVECPVSRDLAWQFWTNVENWPTVDGSVESVRLNGPFAAGSTGVTKSRDIDPVEWRLVEVNDGSSAVIEILVSGASLSFFWEFRDSASGHTEISQAVTIEGDRAAEYAREFGPAFERGIPQGMKKLGEAITRLAGGQA